MVCRDRSNLVAVNTEGAGHGAGDPVRRRRGRDPRPVDDQGLDGRLIEARAGVHRRPSTLVKGPSPEADPPGSWSPPNSTASRARRPPARRRSDEKPDQQVQQDQDNYGHHDRMDEGALQAQSWWPWSRSMMLMMSSTIGAIGRMTSAPSIRPLRLFSIAPPPSLAASNPWLDHGERRLYVGLRRAGHRPLDIRHHAARRGGVQPLLVGRVLDLGEDAFEVEAVRLLARGALEGLR